MTYILLLLFIIFIVIPVGSAMFKIWQFRRRVRRFMADPFGQGGYDGADGRRESHSCSRHRRRSDKKIPRDVGEYVAFTEYEVSTSSTTNHGPASRGRVKQESQITDVEWVDID